jgi:hypothetical protein
VQFLETLDDALAHDILDHIDPTPTAATPKKLVIAHTTPRQPGEKPHKCPTCVRSECCLVSDSSSAFARAGDLARHIKTHDPEYVAAKKTSKKKGEKAEGIAAAPTGME